MRRPRAFSLVEIVVAIGILVPVLIITLGIFPYSHLVNRQARALAQAGDLARTEMERLRAESFVDLASRRWSATRDGVAYVVDTVVEPGPETDLRNVTLTIRWTLQRPDQLVVRSILVQEAGR